MTQASSEEDCPPPPFIDGLSRDLPIINRKGLHARATAKFVQCVDRFDADVKVRRRRVTLSASFAGSRPRYIRKSSPR
jgi:hypothetical protein